MSLCPSVFVLAVFLRAPSPAASEVEAVEGTLEANAVAGLLCGDGMRRCAQNATLRFGPWLALPSEALAS